jgi:predicted outer membrane protein
MPRSSGAKSETQEDAMKMQRRGGGVLCGALLVLGACARPGVSPQAMSMQQDAMMVLATADRGEIEEAQLALQRAQSPQVRAYAQRMVQEHTMDLQMQNDMMAMGVKGSASADMAGMDHSGSMDHMAMAGGTMTANGRSTVESLQRGHQQAMSMLQGMSGAAFDRAYMQRQVDAHSFLLRYTDWLNSTQMGMMGSDTTMVGGSLDDGGRWAVPLSCDPGSSPAAPGNGRSEAGNTSAGNRTPLGTCDGVPQRRPMAHRGHRMTNADVVMMNRQARGMVASHLQMAQQVQRGTM